jgi:nucleotide-binding universal stress UspA family protein
MPRLRVLVPVDVSTEPEFSPDLLSLLEPFEVLLLGYFPIPEQTPVEQAREQREEEAVERVETLMAPFVADGREIESMLVFTHDRTETIERVRDQHEADAILRPGPIERLERVLVPLRGDATLDRIVDFVVALVREVTVGVTLVHVASEEEYRDESELILRGARERLVEHGLDPSLFDLQVAIGERPIAKLAEIATTHDVIVIGETAPSIREFLLGERPDRLLEATASPVFIVRRDQSDEEPGSP